MTYLPQRNLVKMSLLDIFKLVHPREALVEGNKLLPLRIALLGALGARPQEQDHIKG